MTTVQDYPGRNRAVGGRHPAVGTDGRPVVPARQPRASAMRTARRGWSARCTGRASVRARHGGLRTGAPAPVTLDGGPSPCGTRWTCRPAVLDVGTPPTPACARTSRSAAVSTFRCYHGSASTFTLGGFGGYTGRALVVGDVLVRARRSARRPSPSRRTPARVHARVAARRHRGTAAGARLLHRRRHGAVLRHDLEGADPREPHRPPTDGPKPVWSRTDGGDAGLHPSNLHDNPYSVGALNVSGDTPILLGPDGPSLGGFACPLTVVAAPLEARPDQARRHSAVRRRVRRGAHVLRPRRPARVRDPAPTCSAETATTGSCAASRPAVPRSPTSAAATTTSSSSTGTGNSTSDCACACTRSEALIGRLPGIIDITPGVRSLHLHFDPTNLRRGWSDSSGLEELAARDRRFGGAEPHGPVAAVVRRPVHRRGHRPVPQRCPRRGAVAAVEHRVHPAHQRFGSVDDVRDAVFDAEYLVLGLGDVYLGAPLAVPARPAAPPGHHQIQPGAHVDAVRHGRHRRQVPVRLRHGVARRLPVDRAHRPDLVRLPAAPPVRRRHAVAVPVLRPHRLGPGHRRSSCSNTASGRPGGSTSRSPTARSCFADHLKFLRDNADSIAEFESRQSAAFEAEKSAWRRRANSTASSRRPHAGRRHGSRSARGCRRRGSHGRQRVAGRSRSRASRSRGRTPSHSRP